MNSKSGPPKIIPNLRNDVCMHEISDVDSDWPANSPFTCVEESTRAERGFIRCDEAIELSEACLSIWLLISPNSGIMLATIANSHRLRQWGAEDFGVRGLTETRVKFPDPGLLWRVSGMFFCKSFVDTEMIEIRIRWRGPYRHDELPFVRPSPHYGQKVSSLKTEFDTVILAFPRTGCASALTILSRVMPPERPAALRLWL